MMEEEKLPISEKSNFIISDFKKDETHHIIAFIRNDSKIAIPIVSGIITLFTVLIHYFGILSDKLILSFWNIPVNLIEINAKSYLFTLIPSLFLIAAQVFYICGMSAFSPILARWIIVKNQNKTYQKKLKKHKSDTTTSDDSYKVLEQEFELFKKRTLSIQKNKGWYIAQLLIVHLPVFIVYFFLFFSGDASSIGNALFLILGFVIMYWLRYSDLKKRVIEAYKEDEIDFSWLNRKDTRSLKEKVYDSLSDKNLLIGGAIVLTIFTVIVIVMLLVTPWATKRTKEFYITEIDNSSYAMVYCGTDQAVFEKAAIKGDTIIIDKTIQVYRDKGTDINLQQRRFSSVEYNDPYGTKSIPKTLYGKAKKLVQNIFSFLKRQLNNDNSSAPPNTVNPN